MRLCIIPFGFFRRSSETPVKIDQHGLCDGVIGELLIMNFEKSNKKWETFRLVWKVCAKAGMLCSTVPSNGLNMWDHNQI